MNVENRRLIFKSSAAGVLAIASLVLLVCAQSANASIYVGDGKFHDIAGESITGDIVVSNSSVVQVSGLSGQPWGTLVVAAGSEIILGGGTPQVDPPDPPSAPDPPPVPEPSTAIIWSLLTGLGIAIGWRRCDRAV